MFTSPHLGKIVSEFLKGNGRENMRKEHYQLEGNASLRLDDNVQKLDFLVRLYCSGNPYDNNFPLQNIVSSVEIPEKSKKEILSFDVVGSSLYRTFANERLTTISKISIWDPIKLVKIKTMNTWMNKIEVRVGDKVIKLREERQLLARFLVIQQARNLILQEAIGDYEMSVIPRSLFSNDGSLLTPKKKSVLIHLIEEQTHQVEDKIECEDDVSTHIIRPVESSNIIEMENDDITWINSVQLADVPESVAINDAMAIVQSIKKTPVMKKMIDFSDVFCKKIARRAKQYTETRVVFDEYRVNSLKEKTRAQRATSKKASTEINYRVNDHMSLASVSLKDLLSSTKTK